MTLRIYIYINIRHVCMSLLQTTSACATPIDVVEIKQMNLPMLPIEDRHFQQKRLTPFIDHFSRIKILGEGGCGGVYLADIDTPFKHKVAVKFPLGVTWSKVRSIRYDSTYQQRRKDNLRKEAMILQTLAEGPYATARFPAGTPYDIWSSEYMQTIGAEVWQMKQHPGYEHIHRIFDFNESIPCIVSRSHEMSLEHTGFRYSLDPTTQTWSQPGLETWTDIFKQLCQAVEYVHWMTFIHGDIKPENIFCDVLHWGKYHIVLADFGLCTPIGGKLRGGTQLFLPPEADEPKTKPADVTVDYYGVIMTMLTLIGGCAGLYRFPCEAQDTKQYAEALQTMAHDLVTEALCDVAIRGTYDIDERRTLYKQMLDILGAGVELPTFVPVQSELCTGSKRSSKRSHKVAKL